MSLPQADASTIGRTGQIIVGALITGLLSFGAVAFSVSRQPNGQSLMTMLGAGLAGMQILAWIVVPGLVTRAQLKDLGSLSEAEQRSRLAQNYLTKKIIGAALLEGAGFFNWICYLQERQTITLGVVAVLIAMLTFMMPSQGQFESWAEDMKREFC